MQTYSTNSFNTDTSDEFIIEKYVEVMMDIVNQKPRNRIIQSRKCSNLFYNKAKKTLYDMTEYHASKLIAKK